MTAYRFRPFDEGELKGWRLTALVAEAPDAGPWRMAGPCPVCGDEISQVAGESTWTVLGVLPTQDEAGRHASAIVECGCTAMHEGRPAGVATGCGAYGTITARWDATAGLPGAVFRASPAHPDELAWEQKAREHSVDSLSKLRGSAGKWAASIGVFVTAFGLVGFSVGRDQIDKLADPYRWITIVLLVAGALAAALAMIVSTFAANGTPELVPVSGRALRARTHELSRDIAEDLQMARVALGVAAVLVFAGLTFLWAGETRPEPHQTRVTFNDGRGPICGTLLSDTPQEVTIKPAGASDGRKLNPASIESRTFDVDC